MNRCNHVAVLRLYRTLLRLGRHWPTPRDRADRSLLSAICSQTKTLFSKHKDALDVEVKQLGERGVSELKALRRLINNVHARAYPLDSASLPKYVKTMHMEEAQEGIPVLSSKYQAQEQKKYWGADMRTLGKLFEGQRAQSAKTSEAPRKAAKPS